MAALQEGIVIELTSLRFFAAHGLYEEESVVGNAFEVDLKLYTSAPQEEITDISQTINYVEAYETVQEVFKNTRPLLEMLATQIAQKLKEQFPTIEGIEVSIRKLQPPIAGFTGTVGVSYRKVFK